MTRQAYPSDIRDEEWAIVAPYVTLMTADAPQRTHSLREGLHGLRWVVRTGAAWRLMPHDLPSWYTVSQHSQGWITAGVFETLVHALREALRVAAGRDPHPSAVIMDSRTVPSTPESGTRAGYDAAKRRRGSQVHTAVDSMGSLVAAQVTAADVQDRSQVGSLARQVQDVTGDAVEVVCVDQGYPGAAPAQAAQDQHRRLEVVKRPEGTPGFVVRPKRWVVERSNAWAARFRRLARDYEQVAETLRGLHFVAFAILMSKRLMTLILQSA